MNYASIAACAALLLFAVPASAKSLSPGASTIVSTVKALADINTICHDRNQLRAEIKTVTTSLAQGGQLGSNPRSDAMAAGKYIIANCGKL